MLLVLEEGQHASDSLSVSCCWFSVTYSSRGILYFVEIGQSDALIIENVFCYSALSEALAGEMLESAIEFRMTA